MDVSLLLGYASILAPTLIVVIGCAVAGYFMLAPVERGFAGLLLGFFLGPIGLLIAWPMRANALHEREQRDRWRDRDVEAPRADAHAARSFSRQLDELVDQRASGAITEDEYQRRKRDLIG